MNEIFLSGKVGYRDSNGDGIFASHIASFLSYSSRQQDTDVWITLYTGGGDLFEGYAIYSLLKNYVAGNVYIKGVGVVASAGSVIFMAANKENRFIDKRAWIMIHDAKGGVSGTAKEMESKTKSYKEINNTMVSIYSESTGVDKETIAEMMAAETYLNSEKAIELGFAGSIIDEEVDSPSTPEAIAMSAMIGGLDVYPPTFKNNQKPNNSKMENLKDKLVKSLTSIEGLSLTASSDDESIVSLVASIANDNISLKAQIQNKTETISNLQASLADNETKLSAYSTQIKAQESKELAASICREARVELSDENMAKLVRRAELHATISDESAKADIIEDMKLFAKYSGVEIGTNPDLSGTNSRRTDDSNSEKTYEGKLKAEIDSLMASNPNMSFEEARVKAQMIVKP